MYQSKRHLKIIVLAGIVLSGCQQVSDIGFTDERTRCVANILKNPKTPVAAHGSLKAAIKNVCDVRVFGVSDSKGRACAEIEQAGAKKMVCSDDGR